MPRKRTNRRAESLSVLAEELGITTDTLTAWIDKTTLHGMVDVGYNPFTMQRVVPPSVTNYLRKRWGMKDD